jgi:putative transposase
MTRVLEQLISAHGRPESLSSDNGPEFYSRGCSVGPSNGRSRWCSSSRAHADAEPTRRKLPRAAARRVPERTLFRTLNDVRMTLAGSRQEYNCERPHNSLGYRPRLSSGYADVETASRFPHPYSLSGDENISAST